MPKLNKYLITPKLIHSANVKNKLTISNCVSVLLLLILVRQTSDCEFLT